jgi:hypothetical protein
MAIERCLGGKETQYTKGKPKSNLLASVLSPVGEVDKPALAGVQKLQDVSAAVLQHLAQERLAILLRAQVEVANAKNEIRLKYGCPCCMARDNVSTFSLNQGRGQHLASTQATASFGDVYNNVDLPMARSLFRLFPVMHLAERTLLLMTVTLLLLLVIMTAFRFWTAPGTDINTNKLFGKV